LLLAKSKRPGCSLAYIAARRTATMRASSVSGLRSVIFVAS